MSSRRILNRRRTVHREPDDEEPIYYVQRIENKRIANGKIQYYLKWWGYPRSQNTWEPVENLYCIQLIQAYEEAIEPLTIETKNGNGNGKPDGFNRGRQPDKIIGATTDAGGQLMFLVLWKGSSGETDLVPARQANTKCPQLVIQYYQELLTFEGPEDEDKK